MKLFLIGWDDGGIGLADVAAKLKADFHEIVYWTYFDLAGIDKSLFPGTIFHSGFDALAGKPADGIDSSDFVPPGEDLLKQFYETESAILTMMHKKYSWSTIDQRKHFYYHFIQYWYGVTKKLRPDAIIFPAIPHTVYDFFIYDLARMLKIKTIILELVFNSSDRIIAINDYKTGSLDLIEQIKLNAAKQFSIADLKPDTAAHYKSHAQKGIDEKPFYLKDDLIRYRGISNLVIKLRSLWTSLTALRDFSIFVKTLTYLPRRLSSNNLQGEYRSVESKPDFGAKYVYATLQYQPEAQTCPQAGIFADQILMVETLSAALPSDWMVYVKEHPILWRRRGVNYFDCRYRGYYSEIAKLKNVKLVPVDTDSFKLIRNSQAVATGAGSVGWEAILRSKPTLIFGYPWYMHCDGAFRVNDHESCREALEKIKNGFKVSREKVINFLACVDRASFQAYLHESIKAFSKISLEENIKNIASAIEKELGKKQ